MMKHILYGTCILALIGMNACQEKDILEIDTSRSSLNILKGSFDGVEYPESYTFNAYFLGVGAGDYTLHIPVRLSGLPDSIQDRSYQVRVNPDSSAQVEAGQEYTLSPEQVFRKGRMQDSITLTIRVATLNETDNYKIRLELVPGETFERGAKELQYIDIRFMKNVNTPPAFWENESKLNKYTYHPKKCVKFLEISKITDPEWEEPSGSNLLDYWIQVAIQWFQDNETYDENGNRIYFDE